MAAKTAVAAQYRSTRGRRPHLGGRRMSDTRTSSASGRVDRRRANLRSERGASPPSPGLCHSQTKARMRRRTRLSHFGGKATRTAGAVLALPDPGLEVSREGVGSRCRGPLVRTGVSGFRGRASRGRDVVVRRFGPRFRGFAAMGQTARSLSALCASSTSMQRSPRRGTNCSGSPAPSRSRFNERSGRPDRQA